MSTLFDDRQPQPAMALELRVPHRNYSYVVSRTAADIKSMRPSSVCKKGEA